MQIFLETERILLRQFTLHDIDNLLALDSDVEVRRYLDMPAPPLPGVLRTGVAGRLVCRGLAAVVAEPDGLVPADVPECNWYGIHPEPVPAHLPAGRPGGDRASGDGARPPGRTDVRPGGVGRTVQRRIQQRALAPVPAHSRLH